MTVLDHPTGRLVSSNPEVVAYGRIVSPERHHEPTSEAVNERALELEAKYREQGVGDDA